MNGFTADIFFNNGFNGLNGFFLRSQQDFFNNGFIGLNGFVGCVNKRIERILFSGGALVSSAPTEQEDGLNGFTADIFFNNGFIGLNGFTADIFFNNGFNGLNGFFYAANKIFF